MKSAISSCILWELLTITMLESKYSSNTFHQSGRTILSRIDQDRLLSCVMSRIRCALYCQMQRQCDVFYHDPTRNLCIVTRDGQLPSSESSEENTCYRYEKQGSDATSEGWCPISDGYQLLADGGPCVKFFTDLRTWSDANRTCAGFSPSCRLAVLDTQHKNELVIKAGKAMDQQFRWAISIGLSDHTGEGFRWIDGTRMSFQDWGVDGKLLNPRIKCVSIWRYQKWQWAVSHCDEHLHFVCEIVFHV